MRKEHALTQESMCHDQLQQALRHQVSQEEYADAAAHQEMAQLRQLISQQAETMKRFESQSQQYVTQQHDEWTQKQHAQFQKFDGVIRDKDEVIQCLRQELANNNSGGDSDQDGDETPVTDLDLLNDLTNHQVIQIPVGTTEVEDVEVAPPITINKWAKPLPKLDLPARVHLQKASKIKQIWELWSVNVALAMSTWNDIAVTYRHQVYTQSEDSYQQGRRPGMADRFAYEKRYFFGRKAPVPATCDAVEALLRHELLAHIPEWLAKKARVLGCTSSSTILFMCWKEIFPNEDATTFDLVDDLYALPAKIVKWRR